MPRISDTTAMIDVTATMLPSTVMNDRSLPAQMEASARRIGVDELLHARRPWSGQSGQVRSFGSSGFTASPSFKSRTELKGPVMTSSPALRPFSTSKYLSPAMPVLTGMNVALASLIRKTPSVSFRVWPAGSGSVELDLRGRLLRVGLGLRDDLAGRVVDQLAHGHRLDRHGHRLGPRRRRDVGGAGEAGTHLGDLAVDRHRDLEVGRGLAGLPGGGLDDRAVADLGHLAGEGLVRDRVDLDLGRPGRSARTGCRSRRPRLRPR